MLEVQWGGILACGVRVMQTPCTCLFVSHIHHPNHFGGCECVDSLSLDRECPI